MSFIDFNFAERLERYLFEDNWIEPPVYHNNKGKTIRFDLESNSEMEVVKLIDNVFNDIFSIYGDIFVVFYGSEDSVKYFV